MKAFTLILLASLAGFCGALAQGTAFTYQGRLDANGAPANGSYALTFTLFATDTGGSATAGPVTNSLVAISNGLFTVGVDFGSNVWNGSTNWLEIGVATNGDTSFTTLNPRQQLTPTPYAITAENLHGTLAGASLSGTYGNQITLNNPSNQFTGSFSGNGAGLTNVNASTLGGLGPGNFWRTTGNAGTTPNVNFVGTTDNQPLELRVNGQRVLRLVPDPGTNNSPDIIAGSPTNTVTAGLVGDTINGGAMNSIGPSSPLSANNPFGDLGSYSIGASYATIGGGFLNQVQVNGTFSGVAGGALNTIQSGAIESTIGGGFRNTILSNASWSTIAGGTYHVVGDINGFVGGGWTNTIEVSGGVYSVICGGQNNLIRGYANHSVIGGGQNNVITGSAPFPVYGVIGGGYGNSIQSNSSYVTIAGGYLNTIGSNAPSPAVEFATIGGGSRNSNHGHYSTIGGGQLNNIYGDDATISGGNGNSANYASTVGGGALNTANGLGAVVAGGGIWFSNSFIYNVGNTAHGNAAFVGGGAFNYAAGTYSAIGGGFKNTAGGIQFGSGNSPVVAGGYQNTATADFAVVSGGSNNVATGVATAIGGGLGNVATNDYCTIGGGYQNTSSGGFGYATVGGGFQNSATETYATVGGGANGTASGSYSVLSGGYFNTASGTASTVPGGVANVASGAGSFAAGSSAHAAHPNSFVWSDGVSTFSSTTSNQFLIQADSGVGINTASPQQNLSVNGGMNVDQGNNNNGGFNNNLPNGAGLSFGFGSGEGIASQRTSGVNQYDLAFYTSFANRMTILNNGNVGIGTTTPAHLLQVGNAAPPAYCDGFAWVNASDRNSKMDFRTVDSLEVLQKVTNLPMTEWRYKVDADGIRHLGPMAQDFHAAFGLNGSDDKHISTIDEGGVALAAIQGLNQKLEAEAKAKNARIAVLEKRLAELESLLERSMDARPR